MAGHTHQEYENYTANYAEVHDQLEAIKKYWAGFPDPFADELEFNDSQTIALRDLTERARRDQREIPDCRLDSRLGPRLRRERMRGAGMGALDGVERDVAPRSR